MARLIADSGVTGLEHVGRIDVRIHQRDGFLEVADGLLHASLSKPDVTGGPVHLVGFRVKSQGFFNLGRGLILARSVHVHGGFYRMHNGHRRIESQRPLGFGHAILAAEHVVPVHLAQGDQSPGLCIAGVNFGRPPGQANDFAGAYRIAIASRHVVLARHQVTVVGLGALGAVPLNGALLGRQQPHPECLHDGLGDLILQLKMSSSCRS